MQKEVLEKRRKILGDEHPTTARAVYNLAKYNERLAVLHLTADELDEAGKISQSVLETYKNLLGAV